LRTVSILWLWHSGLYDYKYCCNTPHVNSHQLGQHTWSRHMIQTSPKWYLQHCTVNRWHVQHSIIVNVTWRRFNQSAKHTTMNYVWFWQNDFMHCPCSITSRRVSFPVYCSLCHSLRGLVFAWLAKASYDRPGVFWRESVCAFDHVSLNIMVVHAHTTFWWSHVYYMICWVTRTVNSGFSWLGGDVCRELSWWRRSVSWCWCDVGMISVTTDVISLLVYGLPG